MVRSNFIAEDAEGRRGKEFCLHFCEILFHLPSLRSSAASAIKFLRRFCCRSFDPQFVSFAPTNKKPRDLLPGHGA